MLCHACRIHVHRDHPYCLHCGALRRGAQVASFVAPELRLAVGGRTTSVPLVKPVMTIGRTPDNDIVVEDPSVSRRHARIARTPHGFVVEDLRSRNGTQVGPQVLRGSAAPLSDQTALLIGDVPASFTQPRSAAIGGRTMVKAVAVTAMTATEIADLGAAAAATAAGPLGIRPRRRSGWAFKRLSADGRAPLWVLRNERTGRYLQLDERDAYLWQLIDGQNTVRDMLFAFAEQYGELALPRIEAALSAFAGLDLIRGLHRQPAPPEVSRPRRIGGALVRGLLRAELSVGGVDRAAAAVYRSGGWWLFTRTALVGLWLLIGVGLVSFLAGGHRHRVFDIAGAGALGAVVVGLGYLIALVLHELVHALAVKSYGRTVTRGGFMMMFGMPFAFVDTSDMWFGSRWSRLVVTISGPLSTAGLAGAVAIAALELPSSAWSAVCYQLAFGLYLNTLYNMNPLMPLDGYQALADVLRMPRLREEAMAYFSRGMWRDLAARRRPGPRQLGLAAYGAFALITMVGFLGMAVLAWRSRLGGLIHHLLPAPWDTVAAVVIILVAFSPILLRLGVALSRRLRRRGASDRSPETAEVTA